MTQTRNPLTCRSLCDGSWGRSRSSGVRRERSVAAVAAADLAAG